MGLAYLPTKRGGFWGVNVGKNTFSIWLAAGFVGGKTRCFTGFGRAEKIPPLVFQLGREGAWRWWFLHVFNGVKPGSLNGYGGR